MGSDEFTYIWQAVFWLGLLAFSPFAFALSRTCTKVVLDKFSLKNKVKVKYQRADGKVLTCEVDLKDKAPLVDQLQRAVNE